MKIMYKCGGCQNDPRVVEEKKLLAELPDGNMRCKLHGRVFHRVLVDGENQYAIETFNDNQWSVIELLIDKISELRLAVAALVISSQSSQGEEE